MTKRRGGWRAPRSRAGVTLIEMAIVVLIIGILLGAVLAARAIIEEAKFNKLTQTMDEAATAIMAYRERYGLLPGDDGAAAERWPLAADGNSNGWFAWGDANSWGNVVLHLRFAGLVDDSMVAEWGGNPNYPYIKIPFGRLTLFYPDSWDWDGDGTNTYRNCLRMYNVPTDIAKRIINEKDNGAWNYGRIVTNEDPETTTGSTLMVYMAVE